jgi:holo-[acyl-carrier protein] synthase
MIEGLGIDIIEVERVAAKIRKNKGFREMVFSVKEIEYCETKTNKYEHYAARFAVKEAFFKALGTGWRNGTSFNEIEIHHEEKGKPELVLTGETKKTIDPAGTKKFSVSISHLKTIASAVVIIEK